MLYVRYNDESRTIRIYDRKVCNTGNFEIMFCSEVSCDAKCRRIKV